jgi:hypothetical protein
MKQQHTHAPVSPRQDREAAALERMIHRLKAQFPELTVASIEEVLHGNYGQYPRTAHQDGSDPYEPAPQRPAPLRRQASSADRYRRA